MITKLSTFNENNEQGIVTFNDAFIITLLKNNLKDKINYNIVSDTECVITYTSVFGGDNSNMYKDIVNFYDGDYTVEIIIAIENEKLMIKSIEYTFDGTIYQDDDDETKQVGTIDYTYTESEDQYMGDKYSDLVEYIKDIVPLTVSLTEFDGKLLNDSHIEFIKEIGK